MPGKETIVTGCKLLMIFCLSLEGVFLLTAGFPYFVLEIGAEGWRRDHMLPGILVLGIVWVLTVVSCFFYSKRPILVMLGGGMILLINSFRLRQFEPSPYALDWILLHSPELLFLVAACIGALFNRMAQRRAGVDGRAL
jgi:hypothetical protein